MGNSKSSSNKKAGQDTTHDRRQNIDLQRFQNVLLIWLDSSADDNTDASRNTVAQLRRAVNDVNTCTDDAQCIQFIRTIEDSKVCMVISGSLGQCAVPRVHGMSQVDSIFIFDEDQKHHEQWTKDWPKIRGVFSEITSICEALQEAAQQCEQNATPISFVASDAMEDRLDPFFMHTQILKEILLTIDFNDQHIQEYADYCRKVFRDNSRELDYIEQLGRRYHEETPIWWYTRECFLYPMLNRALRTMDGDIIVRMGFFISDLHRQIEREHQKQYAGCGSSAIFTVYRGQGVSKVDFERLTTSRGGLISFNCYLSTSKNRSISLEYAERAARNPDLVGILLTMQIDPSKSTTPFASIHNLSAIAGEDEVLFGMHSVFRVHEIKVMGGNNRLCEVHLLSTSHNEPQLRTLNDYIREESFPDAEGWSRLALVLKEMGQMDKAEEIYETLLKQETSETGKAILYNQLGLIKDSRGEYQEAIEFYQKDLAISEKLLSPTDPNLASTYGNIGVVYREMGEYSKALASYKKALAIQEQSLPATHPTLAKTHGNIGIVYGEMGDYPEAVASHEKALAIQLQMLPPTHPSLASSYGNIAVVYNSMGDSPKALASFEKALAIQQQSLPPTHPSLAMSYNNIGLVYEAMGNYSKACSSLESALKIAERSLPPNHPELQKYRRILERIKQQL